MTDLLRNKTYRNLFFAQVIALLGTGLATVALSLMAFEIEPQSAGVIIGTALAIKMVAYVVISPLATAFLRTLPRKTVLIFLDISRASVAALLPFISEVWQIYALIFVLQACSACFTPLYQATIPDVLPTEAQYTKALSLSRLAYDLENLLSPSLAALLLTLGSWHNLYVGTSIGFIASAMLIAAIVAPLLISAVPQQRSVYQRTTRGMRFYLATPRLRGLLALNLAVAFAGAMVIVNTVVLVQGKLGLSETDTAVAMMFFGAGSMLAAFALPKLLQKVSDRSVMMAATLGLSCTLFLAAFLNSLHGVMMAWWVLGIGYALIQTPSGRLLVRSSHVEDRPDLFAAQFSLSHSCWLIAYPLVGIAGAYTGLSNAFILCAILSLLSLLIAYRVWPSGDDSPLAHSHDDLPADHPHLKDGSTRHTHPFIIDELHGRWPNQ